MQRAHTGPSKTAHGGEAGACSNYDASLTDTGGLLMEGNSTQARTAPWDMAEFCTEGTRACTTSQILKNARSIGTDPASFDDSAGSGDWRSSIMLT